MLVCSSMSGNLSPPDYELADRRALTMPAQVKAISHPLRTAILSLLHERAVTVTGWRSRSSGRRARSPITSGCSPRPDSFRS